MTGLRSGSPFSSRAAPAISGAMSCSPFSRPGAWHHRMHGVGRFVIYDNASADRDDVYAELARRVDCRPGTTRVRRSLSSWDYPYGPPRPLELKFTQTVALNHCRRMS